LILGCAKAKGILNPLMEKITVGDENGKIFLLPIYLTLSFKGNPYASLWVFECKNHLDGSGIIEFQLPIYTLFYRT
jgi:hypothetical protein